MFRAQTLVTLSLMAGVAFGASASRAAGPWKMEYRPGAKERFVHTVEDATELVLSTTPRRNSSQVTKVVLREVGKTNKAGTTPLVETIERIQAHYEVPGVGRYQFDSANPPVQQASAGSFAALRYETLAAVAGSSWTRLLGKDGHVVGAEGLEAVVDRAPSKEGRKELARYFSSENVLTAPDLEREWLPRERTDQGDTWSRRVALGGESLALSVERRYRLEGTVSRAGKELLLISLSDQNPTLELGARAGLNVEEALLRATASKGELLFDPKAGQIVRLEIRTTVKGKVRMPLMIGGKEAKAPQSVLVVEHYSLRELLP